MRGLQSPASGPSPKLSLFRPRTFSYHRSGWAYVLDALKPLLKPGGVLLDPFIEATFCWDLQENIKSGELPFRSHWVAFVHNPPGIPAWHDFDSAPQSIFQLPAWRRSISCCRGIYVFSETMRAWTAQKLEVPVEAVIHPTEPSGHVFTMEKFRANPVRRIVQVGSWLRRLHSIALLNVTTLRKTLLSPRPVPDPRLDFLLRREAANDTKARNADWSSVEIVAFQSADDYDHLLTQNIVFLDLYDTVVNNTVIECIVRRTPVLCNRLPSLIEYLGADYPLFFSDLKDAAAKAQDLSLVEKAHLHLAKIPVQTFSQASFCDSIARGAIYGSL